MVVIKISDGKEKRSKTSESPGSGGLYVWVPFYCVEINEEAEGA
jgi:hypothetical protein